MLPLILTLAGFGVLSVLVVATLLLFRELRHIHRRLDVHAHAIDTLASQHPSVEVPEEPERPKLTLVPGGLAALTLVPFTALARRAPRMVRAGALMAGVGAATGALLLTTPARISTSATPPSGPVPIGSISTPQSAVTTAPTTAAGTSAAPSTPGIASTPGTEPGSVPTHHAVAPVRTPSAPGLGSAPAPSATATIAPTTTSATPTPDPSTTTSSTAPAPTPAATCLLQVTVSGVLDVCLL